MNQHLYMVRACLQRSGVPIWRLRTAGTRLRTSLPVPTAATRQRHMGLHRQNTNPHMAAYRIHTHLTTHRVDKSVDM